MKDNKILYVIIGILLGVVVVLGVLFYVQTDRLQTMEKTVSKLQDTVDETLVQVQDGTLAEETESDVEEAYVDVEGQGEESEEATPTETETPTPTPTETILDAAREFDDLQPQVEELIASAQSSSGGEWAVYVEDLKTGGNMSVNNTKMQAASLIKLYIMGAVYEHYDELGASNVDSLLKQMITVSDNEAANELLGLLGNGDQAAGMLAVNAFCTQNNFDDTQMGRLLLEENPTGENYTSVEDCGKFLYRVYTDKYDHSDDMEALLKAQTLRSKIPAGIPEGIETANKTGELDTVQNDAAIVYGETPYVVCIMSQDVSGTDGPVSSIVTMSNAIYGYINQTQ